MASLLTQAIRKKQQAIANKNTNSGLSYNVPNKNATSGSTVGVSSPYSAISNTAQNIQNSGVTWTPSTSGGSSGGSSTSGSGSSKNSQYSSPTLGDTWDSNTDYQAIINNAVKNGDYVTAAKAEQLRNQKITATGSGYNTTNMYAGYLDSTDYGTLGQQLMANNASWQDVLDIYNSRANKASTTEGLEQFANDEIQQMMLSYILDNMQSESQQNAIDQYNQWMEEYAQENPKEEYQSKYDPQIDALLNEILNRDDFSYDAMNDPLYQQYAEAYRREGDRAMKETLAEAAAGAGGMNTYAITAAQQANSYYNSQLNDKIPELYQLAYEMYLNDKESKVQDLGILQNMDATQYSRYRDTINDWYNDKNFAYGAYQDAVQQGNWQTNLNNNNLWANKEFDNSNYWANKEWEANQEEINYNKTLYEQEQAEDKMWEFIDRGIMPSDDIISNAGWTKEDVELLMSGVVGNGSILPSGRVVSRGSTSGSTSGTKKSNEEEAAQPVKNDKTKTNSGSGDLKYSSVINLGIGAVPDETVLNLVKKGVVILNSDGTVKWADGYNANNYEANMVWNGLIRF